jgi:4-hydroxy-tetrahydrodipicolinate synthase
MKSGCYTALVSPFNQSGEFDREGLEKLIDFQIQNGITGILATGTTGESPTFKWKDHDFVVSLVAKIAKNKCLRIAGTGTNNTQEALEATGHAVKEQVDAVIVVDPYYNCPSSLEIRKEYYEVIAGRFPDMNLIPYVIPGRTASHLLPQDLAILSENYPNVCGVKDATGNPDNMKLTRKYCGPDFMIFSGDDALIYDIMTHSEIRACGAFSVMSNIFPKFMVKLVSLLNQGNNKEALKLHNALKPLLNLVVVTTQENSKFGPVICKSRNPLPIKTLMQILGMPSGHCRKPLGKMTEKGLSILINGAKTVFADNPEFFEPIASYFKVDIEKRLNDSAFHKILIYGY